MRFPSARSENPYGGAVLDRVSGRRTDASFIATALVHPDSLFVPVRDGKSLFRVPDQGTPEPLLLSPADRLGGSDWALLGLRDGRAVFAEFLHPEAPDVPGAVFENLRAFGPTLPDADASILAHARALAIWRAKHRFCGVCGGETAPDHAGNQLRCTQCGTAHFPRTDPAVIMLAIHPDGDRVLMGRGPRFPEGMVSSLAGFVEPGESMEDAVRREVLEETGVRVGDVGYHSSQPWPFPTSVMLGFYAAALTDAITIDPEELTEARWYARAELRDPAAHGFKLPPRDSIARRLIEDFCA